MSVAGGTSRSGRLGAAGETGDWLQEHPQAQARLLDSVQDYAIFLLTPEGHVASWNTGAQRIKGYTADEIVGQHFSVFYPEDALARSWPAQELVWARDRGTFEDEGWRVRKDGSTFWANVVISAVLASDGTLLGFSKVTRDLTERRRQEARLAESERSLRLLVESVQDYAIFQLDRCGAIASWNTGAERIKGYTAEEAVGKHFSMFYPREAVDTGWPQEELMRAERDGRFEDEGWRVRKDGSRFWANVVITAIRDDAGGLVGFSKVTRDLTERRRQDEALRESEQGMRLLVEGTKDHAMFLLGLEGRVRSWNLGAERMLGYTEQAARGEDYAAFFTDEDVAAGKPAMGLQRALSGGFVEAQGWRRHADGTKVWCECSLTLLKDSMGEPSGFVALVHDLTEKRRVEHLQAEGLRMTQFIATLSHELRNPLAPIRHATEALVRRETGPGVKWAAEVIDRQVTQLTRLVDDLLDFSRVAAGRIQLHMGSVDVVDLIRAATGASAALMRAHKHKLRVELPDQPIPVVGDFARLTQVLTNLLNNAAKYTPSGGVVAVTMSRTPETVSVQLTDTGVGMTQSMLELAFEPFVQADRTLERSEGGMGIGLALVKKIVELHSGTVSLASEGVGHGTTVTVTLPVDHEARQPEHCMSQEAVRPRGNRSSRRILVVDDNVDAAESIASLLSEEGHVLEVAFDGTQALATAANFKPEVVLLDVGLPGMNGLQVAEKLREMPGFSAVRLVAVTGYGQPSDIAATKAAGFDLHLTKPFEFDRLLDMLGD